MQARGLARWTKELLELGVEEGDDCREVGEADVAHLPIIQRRLLLKALRAAFPPEGALP